MFSDINGTIPINGNNGDTVMYWKSKGIKDNAVRYRTNSIMNPNNKLIYRTNVTGRGYSALIASKSIYEYINPYLLKDLTSCTILYVMRELNPDTCPGSGTSNSCTRRLPITVQWPNNLGAMNQFSNVRYSSWGNTDFIGMGSWTQDRVDTWGDFAHGQNMLYTTGVCTYFIMCNYNNKTLVMNNGDVSASGSFNNTTFSWPCGFGGPVVEKNGTTDLVNAPPNNYINYAIAEIRIYNKSFTRADFETIKRELQLFYPDSPVIINAAI